MTGTESTSRRAAIIAAVVAIVACFAAAATADASAAPLIYVANSSTNTVSAINPATNQVVGTPIPVGNQPFSLALTPDGRRAYVVNRFSGTVSVIDVASRQVVGDPIPVGEGPTQVAVAPDGRTAWVADASGKELSVIDTQLNQVVHSIPTAGIPWGVSFSPDGKFAYVPLYNESAVQIFEVGTGRSLGQVPVGERPFTVTFTPDGSKAYVVENKGDSVSVIDTATRQVVGEPIPVGAEPWGFAISPDGKRAYVVNGGGESVSVIDTASEQVVKTIPVGESPGEVALTPNGKVAYVTEVGSNDVVAIDTATNETIGAPIPFAAGGPRGIAITPDQSPTAAFTAPIASLGVPAGFSGAASTDPDGSIASWSWAFGDGATATGAIASHTYGAPGTFNAQLAVVDNEGCGAAQVFTGRTAYCSGNPAGTVTHPVEVKAPPLDSVCSSKVRIAGVSHNRKNGTVRLRLKFASTGWFLLFGKKIHAVTRKVRKPGTTTVTLHARVELNKQLKKTLRAGVKYRITFTPTAACAPTTVHRSVALLRVPRPPRHR